MGQAKTVIHFPDDVGLMPARVSWARPIPGPPGKGEEGRAFRAEHKLCMMARGGIDEDPDDVVAPATGRGVAMLPEDDDRLILRAHRPCRNAPMTEDVRPSRDDPAAIQKDNPDTTQHSFEVLLVEIL